MTDLLDAPAYEMSEAQVLAAGPHWQAFVHDLAADERYALLHRWEFWRRPSQAVPLFMGLRFRSWMVRAGRGYGKTRTGAETARQQAKVRKRIALIGPTAADVRDVMIEGESGIMAISPNDERPVYEPSKRRLTWPNGCMGTAYSAEEPERLRGPQHEWAWGDEPASWKYGQAALDNLLLGLRLGKAPWLMLTGTPKPTAWLRKLTGRDDCVTTTGSTYENAGNLAETFIADIVGRYEGTRLGRQELHAEWLDDVEGALWKQAVIDQGRIALWDVAKPWTSLNAWLFANAYPMVTSDRRAWRIIVAVDPPGSTAECGICVATAPINGVAGTDHVVVLDDMSIAGPPEVWGARVVEAVAKWGASVVYVENNQGGDMTRATIHAVDNGINVKQINAHESKQDRAEPVAALYNPVDVTKGGVIVKRPIHVHHLGNLGMLEAQQTTWVPGAKGPEGKSPDRIDALVHAVRVLLKVITYAKSSLSSPARSGLRIPN